MKRKRSLVIICFILSNFFAVHGRVFLTGSNPQQTIFAFPQDILLSPGDMVFFYTTFQQQPWWGDIDQPDLKPSPVYQLTGEKLGVKGSSDYFFHNSNFYTWKNITGFSKTYSEQFKTRYDIEYAYNPYRSNAEGANSVNNTNFKYRNAFSSHDFYVTSYFAWQPHETPYGFKFGFGTSTSFNPDPKFIVNTNGQEFTSNKQMWAWSLSQGWRHFLDGEGRYEEQNSYSIGTTFKFDLQGAATWERLKAGCRLRLNTGVLKLYEWENDSSYPAPQLLKDENLFGFYSDSSEKKISEKTIRVYGNYTWFELDNLVFKTLVLSRFTVADSIHRSAENHDISDGVSEKAQTFVFQINPNVSIYPWDFKYTYLDLAILCNYSHLNYDFTQLYNVNGGQTRSYVSTYSYGPLEDHASTDYSYARQNFFEVAFDANPVFPIYGSASSSMALSVSFMLWTRFKWINKYYGRFEQGSFNLDWTRESYEHETWLNTNINLIYRKNPYLFRFMFGQPLTYNISPSTRILDKSGNQIGVSKPENMWQAQSGVQFGVYVQTTMDNFNVLKEHYLHKNRSQK